MFAIVSPMRPFPADKAGLHCGEEDRGIFDPNLEPFPADKAGLHCGSQTLPPTRRRIPRPFPADKAGLHCGIAVLVLIAVRIGPFPADKAGLHCGAICESRHSVFGGYHSQPIRLGSIAASSADLTAASAPAPIPSR